MLAVLETADVPLFFKNWAINTLIEGNYQADDAFWLKQHEQVPEAVYRIFEFIAKQHPQEAFTFLTEQPWTAEKSMS